VADGLEELDVSLADGEVDLDGEVEAEGLSLVACAVGDGLVAREVGEVLAAGV